MATQLEDESLNGEEVEDFEAEEAGEDEAETEGAEDESGEGDSEEADEDVISFGGVDIRDEDEPEHIRDLRRSYREEKRKRQELEARLTPQEEDAGPEPNIDDYWDKDDPQAEFKRDLLAWNDKRKAAADRGRQVREQQEAIQREFETDLGELETQRSSLKVRDFDTSYDRVTSKLNDAQHAILVQVAKNKAALVYALGKNGDRLEQLAKVTNLAKFAGEVARLDMETRVSRKPATNPEGTVRGSGTFNAKTAGDAKMARLEAEAAKTGDRSNVVKYRRELRLAGRS